MIQNKKRVGPVMREILDTIYLRANAPRYVEGRRLRIESIEHYHGRPWCDLRRSIVRCLEAGLVEAPGGFCRGGYLDLTRAGLRHVDAYVPIHAWTTATGEGEGDYHYMGERVLVGSFCGRPLYRVEVFDVERCERFQLPRWGSTLRPGFMHAPEDIGPITRDILEQAARDLAKLEPVGGK